MRVTSGGMYLNKIVKYIHYEMLASHLRGGLRLPEDTREGQRHMQELTRYFEQLITHQKAPRSQLQPARIPFLLRACWHLHDVHYCPIFFQRASRPLSREVGQ